MALTGNNEFNDNAEVTSYGDDTDKVEGAQGKAGITWDQSETHEL